MPRPVIAPPSSRLLDQTPLERESSAPYRLCRIAAHAVRMCRVLMARLTALRRIAFPSTMANHLPRLGRNRGSSAAATQVSRAGQDDAGIDLTRSPVVSKPRLGVIVVAPRSDPNLAQLWISALGAAWRCRPASRPRVSFRSSPRADRRRVWFFFRTRPRHAPSVGLGVSRAPARILSLHRGTP